MLERTEKIQMSNQNKISQSKAQQSKPQPTSKNKPKVANAATLDVNNPIPFDGSGRCFSYLNQSAYLPFLPPKDDFAQMMLEIRLSSVTHNACITTKKDYCAGNGFKKSDGKDFSEDEKSWFKNMNLNNDPVAEINKKIFESHYTWGNTPIEVVKYSVAGKKQLCIYAHNFMEWRLGTPDDNDIINYGLQSKLFLRKGLILTQDDIKKSKQIPIYNPRKTENQNWIEDDKGAFRTLIWYKNSVAGFPYYGLASAVAAMIYEILEYSGARYNLDNFDNNMVLGGLLALKGNLGQDEANRIANNIIQTHTGNGKRGRIAVVASEEGIDGSDYHDYDTTKDGSFNESDSKWTQKIILANQWDEILAGLASAGTMGKGSEFLKTLIKHKEETVIQPAQTDVLQKVWQNIFQIANEWMGFKLDADEVSFKSFVDLSALKDIDVTPAVTVDEARESQGLKRIGGDKGNTLLGELQKKGGGNVQS